MYSSIVFVFAAALFTLCGCVSPDGVREGWVSRHSLFYRIGGRTVIDGVVDSFLTTALDDGDLDFLRARSSRPWQASEESVARLQKRLVDYLCMATGSTDVYEGADLKTVHEGMSITSEEYDIALRHFCDALEHAKVRAGEREEFLGLIRGVGRSIAVNWEGESPQGAVTGH